MTKEMTYDNIINLITEMVMVKLNESSPHFTRRIYDNVDIKRHIICTPGEQNEFINFILGFYGVQKMSDLGISIERNEESFLYGSEREIVYINFTNDDVYYKAIEWFKAYDEDLRKNILEKRRAMKIEIIQKGMLIPISAFAKNMIHDKEYVIYKIDDTDTMIYFKGQPTYNGTILFNLPNGKHRTLRKTSDAIIKINQIKTIDGKMNDPSPTSIWKAEATDFEII